MQVMFSGPRPVRFPGDPCPIDRQIREKEALWGGPSFFDPAKTQAKIRELAQTHGVPEDEVKEQYAQVLDANLTTAFPHTQDTLLTALENRLRDKE